MSIKGWHCTVPARDAPIEVHDIELQFLKITTTQEQSGRLTGRNY
jgi:hypothetical protein